MSDKRYPHTVLLTASLPRRDVAPPPPRSPCAARHDPDHLRAEREDHRARRKALGRAAVDRRQGDGGSVDRSGPADATMEVESSTRRQQEHAERPAGHAAVPRLWARRTRPERLDGRTRVIVHATALDRRGQPGGEAPKAVVAGGNIIVLTAAAASSRRSAAHAPAGAHAITVQAGDEKESLSITALPPPPSRRAGRRGNGSAHHGGVPSR